MMEKLGINKRDHMGKKLDSLEKHSKRLMCPNETILKDMPLALYEVGYTGPDLSTSPFSRLTVLSTPGILKQ